MSRIDRDRWYEARSVHALGVLTAQWLEGRIASQPGYAPGYGPDEETGDLVPTLARANRAGYLTTASQPDHGPIPEDGIGVWCQRAAVEGWVFAAGAIEGLVSRARRAELIILTHPVSPRMFTRQCGRGIDVTLLDDEVMTGFGAQYTAREVKRRYTGCSAEAIEHLLEATLVTLAAPYYGPDDTVWRVLDDWAEWHVRRSRSA